MSTVERIKLLRNQMVANKIEAYIVPSSDPHLSEYIPDHWKSRAWLSGFTGSAGTLVVTTKNAALWTDSRYFLQGEHELEGSGIELCKMGLPETLSIESWLADNLKKNKTVAFDGRLFSHSTAKELIDKLMSNGFNVDTNFDLIKPIWKDRPPIPKEIAFEHKLMFAGQTVNEKLTLIRGSLRKMDATAFIISTLDDIAWTFNIRGNDVNYNPVVLAYGYVSTERAILFIGCHKINKNLADSLALQGVELMEYKKIGKFIKKIPKSYVVALDASRINHWLATLIPKKVTVKPTISIPTTLKSAKNAVEIENIRQSMVKDGVAMCQFLYWLDSSIGKERVTEITIAEKLFDLRKKQQGFVSESFSTIAGYKEHGAIVHYTATPESASEIKPDGFLLVDSGGQYLQGTTDITRTIHLSSPSQEEKVDYTLVLKGMIQLSMAKFPAGTRGSQLDILARNAMWQNGINYGHGTGHGVGAFLNVHEGPQSIRPNENPVTIESGMVQSNEPALYRPGKYGIRIENLIACRQVNETEFGKFYGFETLTLCPIDTKPIDFKMLLKDEKNWLNEYHALVLEKLSPHLSDEVKTWLEIKTQPV
jgi:Xaa-Pro aminopeptidase